MAYKTPQIIGNCRVKGFLPTGLKDLAHLMDVQGAMELKAANYAMKRAAEYTTPEGGRKRRSHDPMVTSTPCPDRDTLYGDGEPIDYVMNWTQMNALKKQKRKRELRPKAENSDESYEGLHIDESSRRIMSDTEESPSPLSTSKTNQRMDLSSTHTVPRGRKNKSLQHATANNRSESNGKTATRRRRISYMGLLRKADTVTPPPTLYHPNMARKFPETVKRTPEQQDMRTKNTVAARQSRAKARHLQEVTNAEQAQSERENMRCKVTLAMLRTYANKLKECVGMEQIDFTDSKVVDGHKLKYA